MTLSELEDRIFDYARETGVQCDTVIINPTDYNKISKELVKQFPDFVLTKDVTFRANDCAIYRSADQKKGTLTLLRR